MATTTRRRTFPRATEDQFAATRFYTAQDKAATVNAVVRFLKTGMDPAKFTRRAYYFFSVHLSMVAEYDLHGFAWRHFEDDASKRRFLAEVRQDIRRYANLDPDRNSDMARLFAEADEFGASEDGPYADLLTEEYHGL